MSSTVLIDPNGARRRAFCDALGTRAAITSVGEFGSVPKEQEIDIALISLRQHEGHGLDLAKKVRKKFPGATLVVYGRPDGAGKADRAKIEERWGVDLYMPNVPDPSDFAAVVASLVLDRRRASNGTGSTKRTFMENWKIRHAPALKEALTRQYHILPEAAPRGTGEEPSWLELLNGPVNRGTIKALMTKDLFGAKSGSSEVAEDEAPTLPAGRAVTS
jgi:DNA-binding NarL/FixJ family response regulator